MALDLGNEDVLYRLACECEDLFDQLQETSLKTKPKASYIEQCTEFQQRFSIWAAYLGVFAQKSQCLDTRLQNFPDLQDLATRLLDILRCGLHQYKDEISNQERDQATAKSENNQLEASSRPSAFLAAIDSTLARLNRLGVTIRQSSQDNIHVRAEKSTAHLDLTSFTYFCINAVQKLYPDAHEYLKDNLKESMIKRYEGMIHHSSRYMKLKTRREPHVKLSSIQEVPDNEQQTNIRQAEITPATVNRSGAHVLTTPSQSDFSSVNIRRIRSRAKTPDEASTVFHQTSSVQVNQGNYPRPPIMNKSEDILACEWCSESLDKKALSESEWRRHIDRDLKPYICLAEECQEAHPAYSTFNEWFSHMNHHNRRWYQQIYLSPTWVCTICEFDQGFYSNPQVLYSHLQESHLDVYTNEQLRVISQQSKIKQTRAWNNCLLCGFKVEEEDDKDTTGSLKRSKGKLKPEAFKSARTTYPMMHPDHYSSDDSDFSDTSSDLDMGSLQQRLQQTEGRSKAIARHIAVHLQVLMLLTLRFTALQKDDENLVDDDLRSDCVDIDDENSSLKTNDPEKLSEITSRRDVAMKDMGDEHNSGAAKDMENYVVEDDIAVPDTELSLNNDDEFADYVRKAEERRARNEYMMQMESYKAAKKADISVPDTDLSLNDDDEFADYVRKAEEQRARNKDMMQMESGKAAKKDAAANILVKSNIPGTKVAVMKYQFNRPIRLIRDSWFALQERNKHPELPITSAEEIILTWQRKKASTYSSLLGLGIRPQGDGKIIANEYTKGGLQDGRTKVVFEAWTNEGFLKMELEEELRLKREAGERSDEKSIPLDNTMA